MHRQTPGATGAYVSQGSATPVPGTSRYLTNRIIPDMGSPRLDGAYQSYGRQAGDYGSFSPAVGATTPGTPLLQQPRGQGTPYPSGSTLYPSSSLLLHGSSSSLHSTPAERRSGRRAGDSGAQPSLPPMRSLYDDLGESEVRHRRGTTQQPSTPSWGGLGGRSVATYGGHTGERREPQQRQSHVQPMEEEIMEDTEEEARMRNAVGVAAVAAANHKHSDVVALHLEGESHDERCVTVFGFPPNDYEGVQRLLGKPADFLSIRTGQGGNWMHIRFRSAMLADQARARNGSWYVARQCVIGVLRCHDSHHSDSVPLGEARYGGAGRQHSFKPFSGDYGVEETSKTRGAVAQRSFTSKVAEYLFGL